VRRLHLIEAALIGAASIGVMADLSSLFVVSCIVLGLVEATKKESEK